MWNKLNSLFLRYYTVILKSTDYKLSVLNRYFLSKTYLVHITLFI